MDILPPDTESFEGIMARSVLRLRVALGFLPPNPGHERDAWLCGFRYEMVW